MSLALIQWIITFGYIGIFIAVFAESGLLIGFFLPGDSLLFTIGLLASQHYLNIWILLIIAPIAAIVGDSVGYYFGKISGEKLFNKPDSLLFKQEYVDRTERFYKEYGRKAVIIARFIPIVRTFAPVLAGMGSMRYKTFFTFNIIGGIVWTIGFLSISYILGLHFPGLEHYLSYIIIIIIVISVLPVVIDFLRKRNKNN